MMDADRGSPSLALAISVRRAIVLCSTLLDYCCVLSFLSCFLDDRATDVAALYRVMVVVEGGGACIVQRMQ